MIAYLDLADYPWAGQRPRLLAEPFDCTRTKGDTHETVYREFGMRYQVSSSRFPSSESGLPIAAVPSIVPSNAALGCPKRIVDVMRQAGLYQVRWFGLSGGMLTIYRATRVDGDADVPRMALDCCRDRAHGGAFSTREREMLPVEKHR